LTVIYILKPDGRRAGADGSGGAWFGDNLEHALSTTLDQFNRTRSECRHEPGQTASKCVVNERH